MYIGGEPKIGAIYCDGRLIEPLHLPGDPDRRPSSTSSGVSISRGGLSSNYVGPGEIINVFLNGNKVAEKVSFATSLEIKPSGEILVDDVQLECAKMENAGDKVAIDHIVAYGGKTVMRF